MKQLILSFLFVLAICFLGYKLFDHLDKRKCISNQNMLKKLIAENLNKLG